MAFEFSYALSWPALLPDQGAAESAPLWCRLQAESSLPADRRGHFLMIAFRSGRFGLWPARARSPPLPSPVIGSRIGGRPGAVKGRPGRAVAIAVARNYSALRSRDSPPLPALPSLLELEDVLGGGNEETCGPSGTKIGLHSFGLEALSF